MTFNGTEGAPIDITEASTLTTNYRNANPNGIKAFFMGRDILLDILNQQGCMGIRVYYGLDNAGAQKLVFVGADANGDDMLGLIADKGRPCPEDCGKANSLNS
ncbi:MAG: hypothetical protein MUC81_04070 [Bacteroidia bacterium]|jgi:hypothetical protein|nr:hypothetical protein [Bacteroidia bacterium]